MTHRIVVPVVLLLCFSLAACQSEAPQDVDTTEPYEQFGEAVDTDGAVPVQAVAAERTAFVGQTVKIEGTVQEVCQSRGCWLTFRTDDDVVVRINVARDADGEYEFTVPSDISGRRAIVHGELSEEEEAEGAEPQLVLTATGVLVESA